MPRHAVVKISCPLANIGGCKLAVRDCKRLQEISIQLLHSFYMS